MEEVVLVVGDHTVLQCRLSNGSGEARIRWMTVDGEELDDAALTTPEMTSPSISVGNLLLIKILINELFHSLCWLGTNPETFFGAINGRLWCLKHFLSS